MTAAPTPDSSRRAEAEAVVRQFLAQVDKDAEADLATPLFADGIGLDSLETAELSAVLEDAFGRDPFSTGELPGTLGEALAFYDDAAPVGG